MKKVVIDFVQKYLTYQQVKAEHMRPSSTLQPFTVLEWKWEQIASDFASSLPKTRSDNDAIWVIIDRLTKSALFIAIRMNYTLEKLARSCNFEIVRYHGVPKEIVSDRDFGFTSKFWGAFQEPWGTQLSFSTIFLPQTYGQSERTIQTLEDLLCACMLDFGRSWEEHLPLVEFSYNNSYHTSIGMSPLEALYGRPC